MLKMRKKKQMVKNLTNNISKLSFVCLILTIFFVIPQHQSVFAFSTEAQRYIDHYSIPTKNTQDKLLNEAILLSADHFAVYGTPFGDQKQGQYHYLGYDLAGNKFLNPKFPLDLDNGNWFVSYNKIKGTSWIGDTLYDYALIQAPPTKFGLGVEVMCSYTKPNNGKWWE